jgi:hypothetical protein
LLDKRVEIGWPEEAGSVNATRKGRKAPALMSAFVLALFSVTGLMTGVITREVASAAAPARTPSLAQATSTPTGAATATATSSPTSAPIASNQFVVAISVSGQPHPGQNIQVSASATRADSGSPVSGVTCVLGPEGSGEPLLPTWPDAVNTDATGRCAWTLAIPQQTAPGAYRIRVDGYSAQFHYGAFTTIRVA